MQRLPYTYHNPIHGHTHLYAHGSPTHRHAYFHTHSLANTIAISHRAP